MNRYKSALMPAMIAALLLLAFLTAYVGSYLLSSQTDLSGGTSRVRYFPSRWPYQLYAPLGMLEAKITGEEVLFADLAGGDGGHYFP
jgi:hypothetical protein